MRKKAADLKVSRESFRRVVQRNLGLPPLKLRNIHSLTNASEEKRLKKNPYPDLPARSSSTRFGCLHRWEDFHRWTGLQPSKWQDSCCSLWEGDECQPDSKTRLCDGLGRSFCKREDTVGFCPWRSENQRSKRRRTYSRACGETSESQHIWMGKFSFPTGLTLPIEHITGSEPMSPTSYKRKNGLNPALIWIQCISVFGLFWRRKPTENLAYQWERWNDPCSEKGPNCLWMWSVLLWSRLPRDLSNMWSKKVASSNKPLLMLS